MNPRPTVVGGDGKGGSSGGGGYSGWSVRAWLCGRRLGRALVAGARVDGRVGPRRPIVHCGEPIPAQSESEESEWSEVASREQRDWGKISARPQRQQALFFPIPPPTLSHAVCRLPLRPPAGSSPPQFFLALCPMLTHSYPALPHSRAVPPSRVRPGTPPPLPRHPPSRSVSPSSSPSSLKMCVALCPHALLPRADSLAHQVKAARLEHGKKTFGPVLVDQLYGLVPSHAYIRSISSIHVLQWHAWPSCPHLGGFRPRRR